MPAVDRNCLLFTILQQSFLHNILAIVLVRVPGVYLTSKMFPDTLFPMGLATAAGSLTSVVICLIAYSYLRRRQKKDAV